MPAERAEQGPRPPIPAWTRSPLSAPFPRRFGRLRMPRNSRVECRTPERMPAKRAAEFRLER